MYDFMFWSGVVAWCAASLVGLLMVIDVVIDWLVGHFWTKREFLAFVADRLRKKQSADRIPGG